MQHVLRTFNGIDGIERLKNRMEVWHVSGDCNFVSYRASRGDHALVDVLAPESCIS